QPQARDLRAQLQDAATAGEAAGGAFARGGGVSGDVEPYFAVSTPASLITFAHFFVSSAMKARKCSGSSPTSVAPCAASFSFTTGSAMALVASACSAATVSFGVPFGATMPYQFSMRRSGKPASAVVGTSGAVATRLADPITM